MSRIVRFHRTGGPEVLQLDELDIGRPKAGEIRIRVRALGLNRAEAMFRSGAYLEDPNLPAKLGYEAAGEIEELGEGVSGFAVGDAVTCWHSSDQLLLRRWPFPGWLLNSVAV